MRIIRPQQTADKCGMSLATTWRKTKTDPDFPKPVKLSDGITGFIEEEVDAYLAAKVAAARTAAAIKSSVISAAQKSAEARRARKGGQ